MESFLHRSFVVGDGIAKLKAAWDKRQGEYVALDGDSDDELRLLRRVKVEKP